MNLIEAGVFFTELGHKLEEAKHRGLDRAAKLIEDEAKSYPGTYQTDWPALQPETIARKATGDSPLLETGEMRDSIERTVTADEAHIGSNNEKLFWQELGTSRIPPRSVIGLAAMTKEREVKEILGDEIKITLTGR